MSNGTPRLDDLPPEERIVIQALIEQGRQKQVIQKAKDLGYPQELVDDIARVFAEEEDPVVRAFRDVEKAMVAK